MHISRRIIAIIIGITLAVSIPLQCTAQTTNEDTDFSINSRGKTLSENILVKEDTDNMMYGGDRESRNISKEANNIEDRNEIKSFATHSHTDGCYAGHRHTYACNQFDLTIRIENTVRNDGTNISCLYMNCPNGDSTFAAVWKTTNCPYQVDSVGFRDMGVGGQSKTVYFDYANPSPYYEMAAKFDYLYNIVYSYCHFSYVTQYGVDTITIYSGILPAVAYTSDIMFGLTINRCSVCGKTAYQSCGKTQDENTICNQVVTSITPTNPTQTIKKGESIIAKANATFLDDHTGVVNCTSNLNPNVEGPQIVNLTYTGLVNNAKTNGTKTCNITVTVDNYPPVINSVDVKKSINSISLDVKASDTALAASAYKYSIGTGSGTGFKALAETDWLSSATKTFDTLKPNTFYTYIVQVRDNAGYTATPYEQTIYTNVDKPSATITPLEGNSLKIVIADANPASTLYSVKVGDQYANSNGALTQTLSEYTLANKQLELSGLQSNKKYDITVSVKEAGSGQWDSGNTISITTAPDAPKNLSAEKITSSSIKLTWDGINDAFSYKLEREKITPEEIVVESKTFDDIFISSYNDTGLTANQTYRYYIYCKSKTGFYNKKTKESLTIKTLPLLPSGVTGITATIKGSAINLSWTAIGDAVGYEVEASYDGTSHTFKIADTKLTIDTEKYNCQCDIKVRAYNAFTGNNASDSAKWCNSGEWSKQVSYTTDANTPVLNNLETSKVFNNHLTLTWKDKNPDSVQYKLEITSEGKRVREDILSNIVRNGELISCGISQLLPDTKYTFRLKATNSTTKDSDWSNSVVATTLLDPPSVLTGLIAKSYSDRVKLAWNKSERAQQYYIERNNSVIAKVDASAKDGAIIKYEDQQVLSNTEYTYRIKAVNISGDSGWTMPLVKKTLGELPATPRITAVTGSSISATIEWAPVTGATGYEIEADGNVNSVSLNTSYIHNGLEPGSDHSYRVRARNTYGNSSWSNKVSFRTVPILPAIPTEITITPSETQLLVKWNQIQNAISYDIEVDSILVTGIISPEYIAKFSSGEKAGTIHTVRVRSVNKAGASDWSTVISKSLLPNGSGELPTVPIPETPVIAASATGSSITVSWNGIAGASGYQLEIDNNIVYNGTNTSYQQKAVDSGLHQYRVRAGNLSGNSEWSMPAYITIVAENDVTPDDITFFRKDNSNTTIAWKGSAAAVSYRIEVDGVVAKTVISEPTTTIPTVPGKQYRIRIAAITMNNGEQYHWSDNTTFCAPRALPGMTQVKAATGSSISISVAWEELSGVNGYEIDLDGKVINAGTKAAYTINNLSPATTYVIKVRAYNESGAGEWSQGKTITTSEGIAGAPINLSAASTNVATAASGCAITLQWDKINGAASYEIEASNGKTYTATTNKITIESLLPSTRYSFRVRSVNTGGKSPWSSKISIVPEVVTPTNVTVLTKDNVTRISWDKVGGADLYEIELNGVVYTTTKQTSLDLQSNLFYMDRAIRVRAYYGTYKSDWSAVKGYSQTLPVTVSVNQDEEFSILLPVKNADIEKYKLTLTYKPDEVELLDAIEATAEMETKSVYVEELGTHLMVSNSGNVNSITFLIEKQAGAKWSGVASGIRFRSKKTGNITLSYNVTAK